MSLSPCQTCGACCAKFRVSFHWSETLDSSLGVPAELASQLTPHLLAMRGTDQKNPRCVALSGELGCEVGCTIYENRPSPCREFKASYVEDGEPNPLCDQARAAIGLKPLARNA